MKPQALNPNLVAWDISLRGTTFSAARDSRAKDIQGSSQCERERLNYSLINVGRCLDVLRDLRQIAGHDVSRNNLYVGELVCVFMLKIHSGFETDSCGVRVALACVVLLMF